MDTGQGGSFVVQEIQTAIFNYKIIIEEANRLNPSYECSHTQDTLYAIFKCCVPLLEEDLLSSKIPDDERKFVERSIRGLHQLKLAAFTKDVELKDNESHESPLVHLLYLAVEKQAISTSRELSLEGKNWGRFAACSLYLRERVFRDFLDEKEKTYWPGLPTCIMSYMPIKSLQESYHILFSAAADKFEYALATQKKLLKIRATRFFRLEKQCNDHIRTRIAGLKLFPEALRVESNWRELFRPTTNDEKLGPHNWRTHHLMSHADVPFYLPIVTSTWRPSGFYFRACPLDSLRFEFTRPPEAEKVEKLPRRKSKETLFPLTTGCAEWDGFLNFMSQPRQQGPAWY